MYRLFEHPGLADHVFFLSSSVFVLSFYRCQSATSSVSFVFKFFNRRSCDTWYNTKIINKKSLFNIDYRFSKCIRRIIKFLCGVCFTWVNVTWDASHIHHQLASQWMNVRIFSPSLTDHNDMLVNPWKKWERGQNLCSKLHCLVEI